MSAKLQSIVVLVALVLASCDQRSFLAMYQHDINSATQAIESARDDAHRALAYTKRGDAYSEKARYSRAFHLIPLDEYNRLFGLAIQDHDQAIALDPGNADAYYRRGWAYYDRAVLEVVVNGNLVGDAATWSRWFDPAVADYRKAIEINPRHEQAWDSLGLIHETTGELDQAISEYTQEKALNRLGRERLAEAYCLRGGKAKDHAAAIADYLQSIENGAISDGCSCDPYNPLFYLYAEEHKFDAGWDVVHMALKAGKWIDPDLLKILRRESGRNN